MKISIVLVVAAMLSGITAQNQEPIQDYVTVLQNAFDNQLSDYQIRGEGVVTRLLSDDLESAKHQRFILRISSKQTVLVTHNIDIANRVSDLKVDSTVEFYGEYVWNVEGGIIHWTHHDPENYHVDGWLKYNGVTYQ